MVRPDTPASGAGITAVDGGQTRPLRADARRNRDRVLGPPAPLSQPKARTWRSTR